MSRMCFSVLFFFFFFFFFFFLLRNSAIGITARVVSLLKLGMDASTSAAKTPHTRRKGGARTALPPTFFITPFNHVVPSRRMACGVCAIIPLSTRCFFSTGTKQRAVTVTVV